MLYIFDKDGTICRSKSGKKFINSVEDQELIPGVKKKCLDLLAKGHQLAVASNQGGVAFGFMTATEAIETVRDAAKKIGTTLYRVCLMHPEGTTSLFTGESILRKPNPGMIISIADTCGMQHADEIVYIGDRPEDEEAARRAGVQFVWADEFFERETNDES